MRREADRRVGRGRERRALANARGRAWSARSVTVRPSCPMSVTRTRPHAPPPLRRRRLRWAGVTRGSSTAGLAPPHGGRRRPGCAHCRPRATVRARARARVRARARAPAYQRSCRCRRPSRTSSMHARRRCCRGSRASDRRTEAPRAVCGWSACGSLRAPSGAAPRRNRTRAPTGSTPASRDTGSCSVRWRGQGPVPKSSRTRWAGCRPRRPNRRRASMPPTRTPRAGWSACPDRRGCPAHNPRPDSRRGEA